MTSPTSLAIGCDIDKALTPGYQNMTPLHTLRTLHLLVALSIGIVFPVPFLTFPRCLPTTPIRSR
jgi:hypothetical protein